MSRSVDIYLTDGLEADLLSSVPVPDPINPGDVLPDPRTYFRPYTAGGGQGGSMGETPIAPFCANGVTGGVMSSYAKAVSSTPGLMNWWRLNKDVNVNRTGEAPYFANSCGAATLRTLGSGTATLVPGLIANDPDLAVNLNGKHLNAFDYRAYISTNEVWSAEMWVRPSSLGADTAMMGEWMNGDGWLLYSLTGSDLRLYAGSSYIEAPNVLSVNQTYHIVGVWGGFQGPQPDYQSRIYVNGICVKAAFLVASPNLANFGCQFEIGRYKNGGGQRAFNGVVDEVAMYNRMLQPEEVAQHYAAGIGAL